jgi:hypothetical protein
VPITIPAIAPELGFACISLAVLPAAGPVGDGVPPVSPAVSAGRMLKFYFGVEDVIGAEGIGEFSGDVAQLAVGLGTVLENEDTESGGCEGEDAFGEAGVDAAGGEIFGED